MAMNIDTLKDIIRNTGRDPNFNDVENPLGFGSDDMRKQYEKQAAAFNNSKGDGDCFACKGRGMFAVTSKYYGMWRLIFKHCANCSGKGMSSTGPTIGGYTASEDWQAELKTKAKYYLEEAAADTWFFVGGSVGAGKSHICKGICAELWEERPEVFYWNTERMDLLGFEGDAERIETLQRAKCLYIDDLFCGSATTGDINLARRILDYRYEHRLRTIISSEKTYVEVRSASEGTASRISEMTSNELFCISIGKSEDRDYRKG